MMCNHFTGSDVYSFEPIKSTFDTLSTNLNGEKRIHLFKLALGSSSESLVINKSKRITSSSLFPIEEKIKDSYFAEHIVKVGEETINVSTLDIEIPADVPVNLIKIDVQGFELEVLKGGPNTLKRTSIIILEMQNHNIYHNYNFL